MRHIQIKNLARAASVVLGIGALVITFQNCAGDFNPDQYPGDEDSSSQGTSTPGNQTQTPTPTPTPAAPGAPAVAPPTISSVTGSTTTFTGMPVNLTVVAAGESLTYAWYKNGAAIGGAIAPFFTVTAVSVNETGLYQVVVSNSGGSVVRDIPVVVNLAPVPKWVKTSDCSFTPRINVTQCPAAPTVKVNPIANYICNPNAVPTGPCNVGQYCLTGTSLKFALYTCKL